MNYRIYENGVHVNTIVSDPDFIDTYCSENGYTYELEIREEPISLLYTDLEQAQQEVTDRELESIALGQMVTDLEITCLEQGQVLDTMLLGGHADV